MKRLVFLFTLLLAGSVHNNARGYDYYDYPLMDLASVTLMSGFNDLLLGCETGLYFSNVYVGVEAACGLSSLMTSYSDGGVSVSERQFKPGLLGLKVGYSVPLGDFRLIPQAGIARTRLRCGEILAEDNIRGRGIAANAGVKVCYALSDSFEVHLTPEYYYSFAGDSVYRQLYVNYTKVQKWCNGPRIKIGFSIYLAE